MWNGHVVHAKVSLLVLNPTQHSKSASYLHSKSASYLIEHALTLENGPLLSSSDSSRAEWRL